MIREAIKDDIDSLETFIDKCFVEMSYQENGYSYNAETIKKRLSLCMGSDDGLIIINEDNEEINGCMAMVLAESLADENNIMAHECVWHALPCLSNYRRLKIMKSLLDHVVKSEFLKKISVLFINVRHDNKTLQRLLNKMRFKPFETIYQLRKVV